MGNCILTIDFDILLWKDINLYNDYITTDYYVDDFITKHPHLSYCRFDYYLYEFLTGIIMSVPKDKIIFINEHDEIIPYIKEKVKIYNIDHHHDIEYDNSPLNCGNWVKYLYNKNLIDKYYWVRDINSIEPETKKYQYEEIIVNKFIPPKDINLLVICESPQWVSKEYYGLFLTWKTIIENK